MRANRLTLRGAQSVLRVLQTDLEGSAMRADRLDWGERSACSSDRLTLRGAQRVFCRLKAGLETDKVMESPASGSYTDTVPISVSETVTPCQSTCLKQSHRAYQRA